MKKKRVKWNVIIATSVLSFSIAFSVRVAVDLCAWGIDRSEVHEKIKEIKEMVVVEEVTDSDETQVIDQPEVIEEENPYWDYIGMNMINVDFKDLLSINSDTKGWIKVSGTNINYPFVQTNNNSYYLNHSFTKSYNQAGWVFLDYRNGDDDKNTILYAHGRIDQTMFGSLKYIFSNGWLDQKDDHLIKLSSLKENSLWQVFSVYHIPTTNDYLQIDFLNDEEFLSFGEMLKDRSVRPFDVTIGANDKILTLSSCFNKDEKVVVHAKLIKKESK